MRAPAIALLIGLGAMACSAQVPAPVTPTPSPRPGYPPAAQMEVPDGVLYVTDPAAGVPALFRLRSDKEAERLAASRVYSTSPDSSHAVVTRTRDGETAATGILTASTYEEITSSPTLAIWSSDGKRLAYTVPDAMGEGRVRVWAEEINSGERTLLTPESDVYSPIGWTAGGDVLATSANGLELLGNSPHTVPLPEAGQLIEARISPNGLNIAVTIGRGAWDGDFYETRLSGLWALDLGTLGWKRLQDLGSSTSVSSGSPYVSASVSLGSRLAAPPLSKGTPPMEWSPDNRRISYYVPQPRAPDHYFGFALNVVDVVSGQHQQLHNNAAVLDAWSDDGRYLAYMFENSKAQRRLGVLGPDGRTREADILVRGMRWMKDGRLLMDVPGRLSVLDPETMETTDVLTEDGKTVSIFADQGVWSPSGRYLASPTPGDTFHRPSLYIVDTKEGKARPVLEGSDFSGAVWLRE